MSIGVYKRTKEMKTGKYIRSLSQIEKQSEAKIGNKNSFYHKHHSNNAIKKIKNNLKHDKSCNTYLKNYNWTVLKFWTSDILDNIEKCINEIKKVA